MEGNLDAIVHPSDCYGRTRAAEQSQVSREPNDRSWPKAARALHNAVSDLGVKQTFVWVFVFYLARR